MDELYLKPVGKDMSVVTFHEFFMAMSDRISECPPHMCSHQAIALGINAGLKVLEK